MIITCLGHAEFLLELENGMNIVIDPFDASCGYPVHRVKADAVLVSHGHHDHCAVENVASYTQVITKPGTYTLAPDVTVTAVPAWHDDAQGAKRGRTLLFMIEAEGLRVAHMGDLGHMPDDSQIAALRQPDALMIPVGGYYTIDASTASAAAKAMDARIILPMHYRTKYNADWPIASIDDFLALYAPESCIHQPLLRITAADMMCHKPVVVLDAE